MKKSIDSSIRSARIRLLAVACATALSLVACGGGGGGGTTATSSQSTVTAVAITTTNAKPVAADALVNADANSAASSSTTLATAAQVGGGTDVNGALKLAQAARTIVATTPIGSSLATGAQVSQPMSCSSGSGSVSLNTATTGAITAGDTMTVTANNCMQGMQTMSGTMSFTFLTSATSASLSTYPLHLGMRIVATNFVLVESGVTSTMNGDLTIDMTESSPTVATMTLSGSSLTTSVTSSTGSRSSRLQNFSETLSDNGGAVTYSTSATVETTNSHIGTTAVSYTVSTPTPITTDASGNFTGGSMKVVGANSGLLITVTGTNTFQIQVDTNGDGTYESTTTSTLTELKSLL